MKKFAAVFAAAVLVVTLFACADRTALSENVSETASVSLGIADL